MTTTELQSHVDYLAETPGAVERLVADLTDEERRRKVDVVEFSVLENICHLLDIEREGYSVRIQRLLKEDAPVLPDIDGGRLARERDYNSRDMKTALEAFAHARRSNILVLKSLSPDQLDRGGTLETVGPITLSELLRMMRAHDDAHRQEITELRDHLSGRSEEPASK
jgi:DinB superfamily